MPVPTRKRSPGAHVKVPTGYGVGNHFGECPGFAYQGGKWKMRDWITPYLPEDSSLFVEPFAGRGNIFWLQAWLGKVRRYHLNDLRTYKLFNAIKTVDLNRLPEQVSLPEEKYWKQLIEAEDPLGLVMEPMLYRAGGCAENGYYIGGRKDESGKEWRAYYRLEYLNRLNICRCMLTKIPGQITGLPFEQLPWKDWDRKVLVYLDPPYYKVDVQTYSDKDLNYEVLIDTLRRARCRWVLSEYRQEMYVRAFGEPYATRQFSKTIGKSINGGRGWGEECLWRNF